MLALAIAAVLFGACGNDDGSPDVNAGTRGPAFVESVEFVYLESYPVQVRAVVTGSLPTPCHELAWEVGEPADGRVVAEVFSLIDPDRVCIQALEPFEETIDIGSFETGDYTLELNGIEYPFTI